MKLLVDTHLLLWWLADDARLPGKARDMLSDDQNEICVSVASLWEIVLKMDKGKLKVNPSELLNEIHANQFNVVPIEAAHTLTYARLPQHHHDPFDRMLVAQATSESLRLLTHDPQLRNYGEVVHWV